MLNDALIPPVTSPRITKKQHIVSIRYAECEVTRGVTLLEAIMLIAIIGMFTVMSIPRTSSTDKQIAHAAAMSLPLQGGYTRYET